MPSSRRVGRISASTWRSQREYSVWSAVMGWTLWARRMVAGEASERPKYLILPALTRSAMAPTVSSMGVLGSTRCW